MPRVKHAVSSRRHRKKTLKAAKGHYSARHRQYRIAKESAIKGLIRNYVHRKLEKREFRQLWITRINAACEEVGISYSKFMAVLKKAGILLNRKMLADLAVVDRSGFNALADLAKK
ncbi:MAG TPA: 50S ribosomal protein L20 [Candidatus Omnitrophota bacterium]|nr:50S ribosomal protein L20 [Candidatus Omnitrophota bacterium]HPS19774.1 50S ribosomal protein L20 [Candidatus Omnitrophota bacterium]